MGGSIRGRKNHIMFRNSRKSPGAVRRVAASASAGLMEACETRRLLSHGAGGSAMLTGGTLDVEGTRRSDEIMISVHGTDATKLDLVIDGAQVAQVNLA